MFNDEFEELGTNNQRINRIASKKQAEMEASIMYNLQNSE